MLYTLPMIRGSDRVEWALPPSAVGGAEGPTATLGDVAGIGINLVLVRRVVLVVPTADVAELVKVGIGTDIINEGATTLVLSPIVMEEVVGFGVVISAAVVVAILVGLGVTVLLLS